MSLSFLSTTPHKDIARDCSQSGQPGAAALIFALPMGLHSRGAELGWLSQYPHEEEIVFPPLTQLALSSTQIDGAMIVAHTRVQTPHGEGHVT